MRPLLHKLLTSTALTLPIGYYANEKLYTFHRVSPTTPTPSSSLEPILCEGDVLLIRRVDFLPHYITTPGLDASHLAEDNTSKESDKNFDSLLDDETDRLKALKLDAGVGRPAGNPFTLWRSPPNVMPGDLVVVRCPETFTKKRWDVGRLIGLGGQRVRPLDSHHQIESIPPYRIWIESPSPYPNPTSSAAASTLSGKYGPVSKKLLVGRVQRIVWPPKRWGVVERIRPPKGRAWWP